MSENQMLYHIDILNSKTDLNGNRYFAAVITRNLNGAIALGLIDHGSNLRSAIRDMSGGEWGHFTYSEIEMPIREFNRRVKNWQYLGCREE